jgi:Ser/Thr protein kinase RdoA (MazF antagonist)
MENSNDLKIKIEEILGKQINHFSLKGKGDCNYAYYLETFDGEKYIVKVEREYKETEDQNDLVVEGNIIRQLHNAKPTTPVPHVVVVSENPKLYIYEYIEGDLMRGVWDSLSEEEKIDICRSLGRFHAEIGQKLTKDICQESGVDISDSTGLRPKIIEDEYNRLIQDASLPEEFISLVKKAKQIFDGTADNLVFQFIHNDGHPENILIKNKEISGVIDFGDAEYGEVAKEFSRYLRDLPDHFSHIVSSYEEVSGNKLSLSRIVSNSLISGFPEIAEDYHKGGEGRIKSEKMIGFYRELLAI